jgi:hypothetical protein
MARITPSFSEFVQLELDKLVDARAEADRLAGNNMGIVCHSGI